MEDQIDQPPIKHSRPKLSSSYKDQFLQEISSYVHETDFLINNPTNEGCPSTRRAKEMMTSTENIPPELDDPYHKRSQIPKRSKNQQTSQKKSLIPTSKKNSRKLDTKNNGLKDGSTIVPLTDDDLTHYFDLATGSISNDESSPLQSPENINQKKRSKSPGPRLNNNNKNSISEKHPAKRSKSPSVIRKRVKKSVKSPDNSPKVQNSKKQEDNPLTPTIGEDVNYNSKHQSYNDFPNPNNDNYLIEDDDFENEERFHTPQNKRSRNLLNSSTDDLITFSSKSKNKSNISEKTPSTESAGCSPRKIINPPPFHHQDLLDDFNDVFTRKKNDRISKSETPEISLYPIKKKMKKQTNNRKKDSTISKLSKNLNIDDDYENSEDTGENNVNDFKNKKLTDLDIQKMKSGWTAPNVHAFQNSSSPINYSSLSTKESSQQQKSNSLDEEKLLNKSLSTGSSSPKNAFENLRSSDDSEEEAKQDQNYFIQKDLNDKNNTKPIINNANMGEKIINDYDLIIFSPMRQTNSNKISFSSENSVKKDENVKQKRIPNSPLSPKNEIFKQENTDNNNNKEFTPSHLFFVNANSINSEEYEFLSDKPNNNTPSQNNQVDDKQEDETSMTNSDLMRFTVIEMKNDIIPNSPPQKIEIIPIEPIEPINSTGNIAPPQKTVTNSMIAEFLDFGSNSPQKINNSFDNNEIGNLLENANDKKPIQTKSLNENSNLISLSIVKTPEKMDDNKNEKGQNNNEFDNSEVVLSCSLISPTRNAQAEQEKEEKLENDNSHTCIENSNFISFSNIEADSNNAGMKQIASAASPPKIEFLSFSDQADPNIVPPEKMNLSIFNSPHKQGEDRSKKYKLDSSDIFNFSKHSSESQKQSDDDNKDINNNNLSSSPSLLQTNYDDKQSNKISSNVLSEYSEKADSERVDSPDRGNYLDLFKSPNKASYMNNKKNYNVSLFSEGLSPNNIKKSFSGSHAKNGSISSSPTSESASESVAVSTSTLSSSSPRKHVRREPKKAIAMLNRHFVSINEESSSGQFTSSSAIEASKSQQKESKLSPVPQEKITDEENNNDQSEFNTDFNKFVTGDKNALLKTYENSDANATFNDDEIVIDKNNENTEINEIEIIEEEEEENDEIFNQNLSKNELEEEDFNELIENEVKVKTDDAIDNNEEEELLNEEHKFQYSVELQSIPTLRSTIKNNNTNEIGIPATSEKAKRLTYEKVDEIQKKVFDQFGNGGETETENETETKNYMKYESRDLVEESGNEKDNSIIASDHKNYRKKKPTSAFMISQNDYSYSEIDTESKFVNSKNYETNNHEYEEEAIEIENEKDIENENINENENEEETQVEADNNVNNDEAQLIESELAEAISERNFTPQVIHDLVHYVTGVPKRTPKNRNLNGSLNASGNLNNTSIIDNEDTIFAFQERFVSIIEVEILTNEGAINIFPTNLNDYLKDRGSFLSEEKKEKAAKSTSTNQPKKQAKSENTKKTQNDTNTNTKSPKSPARNKSPTHASYIKSPSNYNNSPYKGPSPKKKLNEKSPSKQSLSNRQSPSQLTKSPNSKRTANSKKQRDFGEPFVSSKPNSQKQQKKTNPKGKQSSKKQSILENELEFDNENENQFENDDEIENQNLEDNSNDDFVSVSTPTKSPKSSKSPTPIKEKNTKKSSPFDNNYNDDNDDQNDEFVSVSTPKKKQTKSINSSTNSPYSKRQANSNTKNSNLNKNSNRKSTPNSKLSKQNNNRESRFSHSNNDDPSDLDDFTPVQTQQVTKKISNTTASPSPFIGNSLSKPKRIESDSSNSFLNASNNSDEVNSSSVLINNNNNNNYDPDEFVSVSSNATPQKASLNTNTNTTISSTNSNSTKSRNSITAKSPVKDNSTNSNSNKKKQTTRKSLQKKPTTSSSDDFLSQQETQQQQSKKSGVQSNPKKKSTQSNVTRMKPGLLGHSTSTTNSSNIHSNNQTSASTNKKETNDSLNHQNPFAKGKNKGLQFSLRKPLKKASVVNKKTTPNVNEREENFEDEDEEINNNNNENIENDENFEQVNAIEDDEQPTTTSTNRKFYDDRQTNSKRNLYSKQTTKQKQNEISPKTGSNKKKNQLLSPKTIEDPFKALKASKQSQQQNNSNSGGGSGRKKKNSFQPISKNNSNNNGQTNTGKRKKAQTSSASGNPPQNKKNMLNETNNNEASNSSSSFQLAFNIDTSLFSDASFAKKCLMPQSSPNKKPKTLASVLIPANDDYSEED